MKIKLLHVFLMRWKSDNIGYKDAVYILVRVYRPD